MENFLYKCEICTTARFSVVDKDEVWFVDCAACRSMQFHHKVVIIRISSLQEIGQFYCKMDGNTEKDIKELENNNIKEEGT